MPVAYPNNLYTTTNNYSPIVSAAAVTPNDGTDLPGGVTRALLVGGAGNVVMTLADGVDVTIAIPATATGIPLYFAVKRVKATSTTATLIIACY